MVYMTVPAGFPQGRLEQALSVDGYQVGDIHRHQTTPPEEELGSGKHPGDNFFAHFHLGAGEEAVTATLIKSETVAVAEVPSRVYHVTAAANLPGVRRSGLEPRTSGHHDGRVYVFGSPQEAMGTMTVGSGLHGLKRASQYALLEIDTTGLNFSEDWEFGADSTAMWTRQAIPSTVISLKRTFAAGETYS